MFVDHDRDHDHHHETLRVLFRRLPEAEPVDGFADRVLAAAGIVPEPVVAGWAGAGLTSGGLGRIAARAFLAACLFLVAVTLAWLPGLALAAGRLLSFDEVIGVAAAVFVAAVEHLPAVITVGKALTSTLEALAAAATSPPVLVAGFLALASATLAWRGLVQLLSPQRSPAHVVSA